MCANINVGSLIFIYIDIKIMYVTMLTEEFPSIHILDDPETSPVRRLPHQGISARLQTTGHQTVNISHRQ